MLCNDSGCALCCILKTSFKTTVANPNGAWVLSPCILYIELRSFKCSFGAGIYSSSAANKFVLLFSDLISDLRFCCIRAYSYSANGSGALILTKVVLGNVYNVNGFAAVTSLPAGYNSVSDHRLESWKSFIFVSNTIGRIRSPTGGFERDHRLFRWCDSACLSDCFQMKTLCIYGYFLLTSSYGFEIRIYQEHWHVLLSTVQW